MPGSTLPRVQTLCFSPDSDLAATARGAELVVLDVSAQTCLCNLRGADGELTAASSRAGGREG